MLNRDEIKKIINEHVETLKTLSDYTVLPIATLHLRNSITPKQLSNMVCEDVWLCNDSDNSPMNTIQLGYDSYSGMIQVTCDEYPESTLENDTVCESIDAGISFWFTIYNALS